jgi:hypothetical protein
VKSYVGAAFSEKKLTFRKSLKQATQSDSRGTFVSQATSLSRIERQRGGVISRSCGLVY